jgi:O-antigen/teichoic acid export membrane protein
MEIRLILLSITASAFSYLLTLYLIRELSLQSFGEYSYLLLVSSLASVFIIFGTDNTVVRDFNRYKSKNEFTGLLLIFKITNLLLFLVFLKFLNFNYIPEVFCFLLVIIYLGSSFEIYKKNIVFANIFLMERAFYTLLVFVIFTILRVDVTFVYISMLIVSFISLCFQVNYLKPSFKKLNYSAFFSLYKNNFFIVLSVVILFGYGGISRFILENKFGKESLGVFSAFWQFVMIITLVQTQIEKVWRIKISKINDFSKFFTLSKNYLIKTTIPLMILSFLIMYFRDFFVLFLFGQKFLIYSELLISISIYFLIVNLDSLLRMLYIHCSIDKQYMMCHFISVALMLFALSFINYNLLFFSIVVVVAHSFAVFLLIILFYKNNYTNSFLWEKKDG